MKDSIKTGFNLKVFFQKQWSNILFFGIVLLFLIPSSRIYFQSKIANLFSVSPTIVDAKSRLTLSNYNLILEDMKGQTLNLKQSKGKPVLINFWATWCAPCLAEMPELAALYESYKDEVDFYFISQEKKETLKRFLDSKQYHLPVYIQKSRSPLPLENNALPSTYLINSNGEIVAKAHKAAKWNDKHIQKLINKM